MEQISRVGVPRALEIKDDIYRLVIRLDAAPTQGWLNAFKAATPVAGALQPAAVSVDKAELFFHSEERAVPEWIAHIRLWMDAANATLVQEDKAMNVWRAAEEAHRQETQRRLAEMNEKLKGL
jgi:hypothetical protein